jgi:hypothetical protein
MIHPQQPEGKRTLRATVRRSMEPAPTWAACKWLPRCYGARCVRDHWAVVGLWHSELHRALELPQLDEACVGCPVLVDILEAAA